MYVQYTWDCVCIYMSAPASTTLAFSKYVCMRLKKTHPPTKQKDSVNSHLDFWCSTLSAGKDLSKVAFGEGAVTAFRWNWNYNCSQRSCTYSIHAIVYPLISALQTANSHLDF